ncbi:alpha/beta hydrolase [Lactiplantibacillus garii]|uniref:Alpha/beta hydrolase n=1 Tax=Lactiplantibacillus garii TaxID=2306423 RepID=A0A426D9R4_9LACO|nr:alpha/beta hydrolase [Lactiplantibacillus garii]RRK11303.1 alpha/beta hydrolase [Lactiplantibacillus garii]
MQVEHQTLSAAEHPFQVTAYWLDQISDFEEPVNYPVMIICPGGGFTYHSGREEAPIATRFNAEGMHTIVLNYQLENDGTTVYPWALQQVAQTIAWVTEHAQQRHVATDRIILTGFSAGGHVVALYNAVTTDPALRQAYGLNDYPGEHAAVVLGYPVIDLNAGFPGSAAERDKVTTDARLWAAQKLVSEETKPAFVWQTATDELVPAQNSLLYVQALMAKNVDVEYHLFGSGIHGLALANHVTEKPNKAKYLNDQASQWTKLATRWLQRQGLLAGEF